MCAATDHDDAKSDLDEIHKLYLPFSTEFRERAKL